MLLNMITLGRALTGFINQMERKREYLTYIKYVNIGIIWDLANLQFDHINQIKH
jgi:hypothetical protein